MKPLLIIPPSPARWPALRDLPLHDDPIWQDDLEKRFARGLPRSQDAFAIFADGGHVLGTACICKRHDLGVLTRVYVQPDHRQRGLARQLVDTVLSWFDMTGGKWLYATTTADLLEGLFSKVRFRDVHRVAATPHDATVILRAAADVPDDPLLAADGPVTVHDLSRANWPTMVVLMHNRAGADPRVPLGESSVAAEATALDLIAQLEAGTCSLKAAFQGPRLIGLASIATQPEGERTYAMIMPHDDVPQVLRNAVVEFAQAGGYQQVDFPMEALAEQGRGDARFGPLRATDRYRQPQFRGRGGRTVGRLTPAPPRRY